MHSLSGPTTLAVPLTAGALSASQNQGFAEAEEISRIFRHLCVLNLLNMPVHMSVLRVVLNTHDISIMACLVMYQIDARHPPHHVLSFVTSILTQTSTGTYFQMQT